MMTGDGNGMEMDRNEMAFCAFFGTYCIYCKSRLSVCKTFCTSVVKFFHTQGTFIQDSLAEGFGD